MHPVRSVRSLYPLALAEGEGIGTAYEYFAKRLTLTRWLASLPRPRSVLIAGLPEKYGSSLDFFLLANELGVAKAVIIDDRGPALEKLKQSLARTRAVGELAGLHPRCMQVAAMARCTE